MDPGLEMDALPQPYRMIVKLIESEILDPVWLEVTRLHPELLQDSNGEPLSLRPNFALKNVCTPSSVIEQTFLATSLVESQGFLIMTTSNDACVLADPASGAILQSLLLKQGDYSALNLQPTASPMKASPLWIAAISPPISNDRVLRIVVCSLIEMLEPLAPPEGGDGGKKAPPPKKGASAEPEPMKKVGKCRVAIVEVRLGAIGRLKSPTLIKMSLVFECFMSIPSPSKTEIKSVDLSADAELLSVATTGGVLLYSLPKIADKLEQGNMENITEDAEGDDEVEESKPVALEPCLVLDTLGFFGGKVVKHVILSPLAPLGAAATSATSVATSASRKTPASASGPTALATNAKYHSQVTPFYKTAMSVTFEENALWQMLGLKTTSPDPSVLVSDLSDKLSAVVISQWNLAANVSSMTLDEGRSLAVLGLCDGSLCMWNLSTRTFTSFVGRHETAPTSLCISKAETSDGKGEFCYYLLSGALDGTLCFFTLHIPRSVSSDFFFSSSSVSASTTTAPCISATFNAFRMDVDPGCSIVSIRSLKNLPLAVVQSSDGLSAVYDLQGSVLLGKFVLYSGIMSKQIDWHIGSLKEIVAASMAVESSPETTAPTNDEKAARVGSATTSTAAAASVPKRVAKFSVTSNASVREIEGLDSVATPSHHGFHSVYYRNDSPVLAMFRLEDIFVSFYPGLNAVCGQGTAGGGSDLARMLNVFNTLLTSERLDAKLATLKMASRFDVGGGGGMDISRAVSGAPATRNGKARKDSRTGTGGGGGGVGGNKGAGGTASSSAARRGSDSNRAGHRNSKGALIGTDVLLGAGSSMPKFSSDAESISKLTWDRVAEPGIIAAKSAAKSQTDRAPRKQRVMNALAGLSGAL